MSGINYNNDFFGWQGTISRKNYTINLAIVTALYVALTNVNFQAFSPFIPIKFLLTAMMVTADLLKIVLVMSALSLVYRRISDFSCTKPYKFQLFMKRIFVFLYVVPVLYVFLRSFFIIPIIITILDNIIFFICIPISMIAAIIFAFIKSIKR